jgi:hypothetical protein
VAMEPDQLRAAVAAGWVGVAITSVEAISRLEQAGLHVDRLLEAPSFHTSVPSGRFLNASTRASTLRALALVAVTPGP